MNIRQRFTVVCIKSRYTHLNIHVSSYLDQVKVFVICSMCSWRLCWLNRVGIRDKNNAQKYRHLHFICGILYVLNDDVLFFMLILHPFSPTLFELFVALNKCYLIRFPVFHFVKIVRVFKIYLFLLVDNNLLAPSLKCF